MIWFGSLLLTLAAASGDSVPDGIAGRVRAVLASDWKVPADRVVLSWGRVASRAALPDSAPVRVLGSGRDGRYVVAIRLPAGEAAVSVRAGVADSVWVVTRPVSTGQRLAAADLAREERAVWGPPASDSGGTPIGWETRRNLAAGDLASGANVAEPAVIEPGDRIDFVWEQEGFRIVREAVAATRARRGERVVGRDLEGRQQLTGTATGPGTARLEGKGRR
ncbi:MAG: flagellar basal body P-ring formation protein FlgA [Gemmatimonadales bacterium]|nr:flagellar basal body P-ring formation protein FlgA [Gemmatimonadales bacterium]